MVIRKNTFCWKFRGLARSAMIIISVSNTDRLFCHSVDKTSSFAPMMHSVLTWALKGTYGSGKRDFFALKYFKIPSQERKGKRY